MASDSNITVTTSTGNSSIQNSIKSDSYTMDSSTIIANGNSFSNNNYTLSSDSYTLSSTGCGLTGTTTTVSDWGMMVAPSPYISNSWMSVEDIVEKKLAEERNKEKMSNIDLNFGPYTSNNLRLSTYGIALKNKENKWVSFDRERNAIIDVNILNIEIESSKIFYKIPKAISDVNIGDIVLHNGNLMFVEEIRDNRFVVINPYEGTELTILPSLSPFGFNYITVIVSLMDYLPAADMNNPFGSLLPLLLGKDNNNLLAMALLQKEDIDIDPMLLMLTGNNPLFYMLLINKKSNKKDYYNQVKEILNNNKNSKD